jgi:dTDP-D-glucose 4,6-dehydratase
VRANNIYGDYQLAEKLIPKSMFYAQSKKNFSIHGSKKLKRHFLHTDDFTNAIQIIFNTWQSCGGKIFNISGENSYEVREVVEAIYRMQGLSPELYIKLGRDRPFNDAEYKVNDDLIKSLGWRPKVEFWPSLGDILSRKAYRDLSGNSS